MRRGEKEKEGKAGKRKGGEERGKKGGNKREKYFKTFHFFF